VEVQNASSLATITGTVFNDANGDGAQDNGETGLAGVQVYATLATSAISSPGPTTTTNATAATRCRTWPRETTSSARFDSGLRPNNPSNGFGHHVTISAGRRFRDRTR